MKRGLTLWRQVIFPWISCLAGEGQTPFQTEPSQDEETFPLAKKQKTSRGRSATSQVANRFEKTRLELDHDSSLNDVAGEPSTADSAGLPKRLPTVFLEDQTESIVSENESPDVPFRYSLNPYRGCEHGCSYCYARPTHEYLGMSAGLDFETKVLVKERAVELLRKFLARPKWQAQSLMLSGVTDPYQPVERTKLITRQLLQLLSECRHPVSLITKNALIERDLDILGPMAEQGLVHAAISITTLDAELARDMEPRTSSPEARLRAIHSLSSAGVPVRVMTAPIVPGLNDHEIPKLLEAAADAGASSCGYVMLRLPGSVRPVFENWLAEVRPEATERVIAKIKEVRGGEMSDSQFGRRMRGTGNRADQISALFKVFAKKYGLDGQPTPVRTDLFVPPSDESGQLMLF